MSIESTIANAENELKKAKVSKRELEASTFPVPDYLIDKIEDIEFVINDIKNAASVIKNINDRGEY
jgi:hypothetical protein